MQDLGELNVSCKKQVTKTSWSVFKWQRFRSSEEECHQEDSDLFRWLYLPSILSRNVWAVWKCCSKRAYENLLQQMGNVRDEEQRSASLLGKSRASLQQWLHDHTSWSESKQHLMQTRFTCDTLNKSAFTLKCIQWLNTEYICSRRRSSLINCSTTWNKDNI